MGKLIALLHPLLLLITSMLKSLVTVNTNDNHMIPGTFLPAAMKLGRHPEQTPPWTRHIPIPPPPDQAHHSSPDQAHHPPGTNTSPQTRHTPPGSRLPWEETPPGPGTPLGTDTPPEQTPPAEEHAGRCGQCAGGMHPSEMHSCYELNYS